MAKKIHKKKVETASFVKTEKDFDLWEDYMAFGPQYDTANDCPLIPGETECVQELPFKKLSAETRKALRSAMVNRVVEYWQSERLIPEGGIVKELRKAAIQETYQLTGQYAKNSDEVKHLQK